MKDDTSHGPKPRVFDGPDKGQYKRSKAHENRIAKELGGKRLPRSGGLYRTSGETARDSKVTAGGDLSTKDFLVEHKFTQNKSLSLKKEWLDKVQEGAKAANKWAALGITFDLGNGKTEDWIAVPLAVFQHITDKGED